MVMAMIKAIKVDGGECQEAFSIEIKRSQQPAILILRNATRGERPFEGVDIFEATLEIRRHLESEGLLLLCNGSRFDAYPSGMSRQMSSGRKLYLHQIGVPGRPGTVVDIFDEAPTDRVGTIARQDEYMAKWRNSIG
jgi:hypothetical protein